LISENGVNIPEEAESFLVDMELNAKTGILVAYDGDFIGLVGVTDPLKREAAVVIEGLKKMGVYPVMVTGDNWRTALAVAKEVGLNSHVVLQASAFHFVILQHSIILINMSSILLPMWSMRTYIC
jgi:cation transport ATPase